jgi:hypothetical protein
LTKTEVKKYAVILSILMVLPIAGCKTMGDSLVIHDELFTYNVPYDQGYMMVVEAVNETPGWRLGSVDKRAGKVVVYNKSFMSDDRVVILIKNIGKEKMSVELAPDSQAIKDVDALLKQIDKAFMP